MPGSTPAQSKPANGFGRGGRTGLNVPQTKTDQFPACWLSGGRAEDLQRIAAP